MGSANPRRVLLVGSIPLKSAAEVFAAVSETLGGLLPRIPDGETGARINWIMFQGEKIARMESMTPAGGTELNGLRVPWVRLKPGVTPQSLNFRPLGYAAAAAESYGIFRQLRADGKIPAGSRFQVSLPTPMAVMWAFIVADQFRSVWPVYEQAMTEEIAEIVRTIPHPDLAIQMDVAAEVVALETREPARNLSVDELVEAIARVSNLVPTGVELGIHLCYGDPGGKHVVQPKDLGFSVDLANRLIAAINRPLGWIHMPVPIDRNDDAYFVPLKNLGLKPGTELYLGLVHFRDGLEGAKRRIAVAERIAPQNFGIAFECGLGRRPPEEPIRPFLELHREIATSA